MLDSEAEEFAISKRALSQAQLDTSFELPGFESTHPSKSLQPRLAEIAVEQLHRFYPDVFGAESRKNRVARA